MTQHYLVKYKDHWADEMYIEGFALLTEEDKEFFDSITQENLPTTHHLGTNQDIEYKELDRLLERYTWVSIGNMEYQVFKKYLGEDFGQFYYPKIAEDEDE